MRDRIRVLNEDVHRQQASEREAREALRAADAAIAESNRTLESLRREARAAGEQVRQRAAEADSLEQMLAAQRPVVARLLLSRLVAPAPDSLRALLSGNDPADATRTTRYLERLTRATGSYLDQVRRTAEDANMRRAAASARRTRLAEIDAEQRRANERIAEERGNRERALRNIAFELRRAKKQLGRLQADESRLSRVVEEIARLIAVRPGAGFLALRAPDGTNIPRERSPPFSRLRGQLPSPLAGDVVARFGERRRFAAYEPASEAAGGSGDRPAPPGSGRGILIRPVGSGPVRAVAAGQVVYADWMLGFGNLIIVDHGESYLSIYANADALSRKVGDRVAGGETLGTVGGPGTRSAPEGSALYFELRHLGRAFDPMKWLSRR